MSTETQLPSLKSIAVIDGPVHLESHAGLVFAVTCDGVFRFDGEKMIRVNFYEIQPEGEPA